MFQCLYYDQYSDTSFVVDDNFTQSTPYFGPRGIIQVYSDRNLPIIPNLKIYYQQFHPKFRMRELELSTYTYAFAYPYIQFKEKYYPCLKRHIEKLSYIGK